MARSEKTATLAVECRRFEAVEDFTAGCSSLFDRLHVIRGTALANPLDNPASRPTLPPYGHRT
jgi:hypothetical protein